MKKSKTNLITSSFGNNVFFERQVFTDLTDDMTIIVNESEEDAIVMKDGVVMDTIHGGKNSIFAKGELKKDKISVIEVIFMSKNAKVQMNWGTANHFDFEDQIYNLPIKIGFNGEISVQIGNHRKFYAEIVGRDTLYDLDKLKNRVRGFLLSILKPAISQFMVEKKLSYLQFEQHLTEIANGVYPTIKKAFLENYGLNVNELIILGIIMNEDNKASIEKRKNDLLNEDKDKEAEDIARKDRISELEHQRTMDYKNLEVKESVLKYGIQLEEKNMNPVSGEEESIYCTNCGKKHSKEAKFCSNCGTRL